LLGPLQGFFGVRDAKLRQARFARHRDGAAQRLDGRVRVGRGHLRLACGPV
jgi:hypothetical protein